MSNVRSLTWIGDSLANRNRKSQAPSLIHLAAHSLHLFTEHLVPASYGVRGWRCRHVRGHGACPCQFATHRVNSEHKGIRTLKRKRQGSLIKERGGTSQARKMKKGDPSRRNGM